MNLFTCRIMKSWVCTVFALLSGAHAEEVRVAVAANFAAAMQTMAQVFEKETGHRVLLSVGATGSFYAQIKNGAPYDVLLAADQATPRKLEQEGLALLGSRSTYALGQLVLYSQQPGLVDAQGHVLRTQTLVRLAIANPALAPYGAAAIETLRALNLLGHWQPKLVQGDNVAQAYQFVRSNNAPLGFVAMSQVYANGRLQGGSAWVVPQHLYTPIQQDAVLLIKGQHNPAAKALLEDLHSEKTKALIRGFGYDTP
jgi:molybdate transport system substrate-binding protein